MSATEELKGLVDDLETETSDGKLKLRDIMSAWGSRAFGPILLVIGLLAASPIGAIPGMSIVFGLLVTVIAAQLVIGRTHPWIPERIAQQEFSQDVTDRSLNFLRKAIDKTGFLFSERLSVLTEPPADRLIAVACIALATTFYPLALVPFAVFVPSMTIAVFGMAIAARDGVWAVIGVALTCVTFALLAWGVTTWL
ncbi:MAG: exopolysaccharide biosynthesis protein [Pseudomonadota bacterium]